MPGSRVGTLPQLRVLDCFGLSVLSHMLATGVLERLCGKLIGGTLPTCDDVGGDYSQSIHSMAFERRSRHG